MGAFFTGTTFFTGALAVGFAGVFTGVFATGLLAVAEVGGFAAGVVAVGEMSFNFNFGAL